MSFSWTLFRDKIFLNKEFAESIAMELKGKKIKDGSTVLLAANEFLMDPEFTLTYNQPSEEPLGVNFPGRYHLVIAADYFDAQNKDGRVGVIDLTGSKGDDGPDGGKGADGEPTSEPMEPEVWAMLVIKEDVELMERME